MIIAKDGIISMKGTIEDLDGEVAMILMYYATSLQQEGISTELACENLLYYMKLLKRIMECITEGESLEDNVFRILDEVFEQLKNLN